MAKRRILSTKLLTPLQESILGGDGIIIDQYSFIASEKTSTKIPPCVRNAIFSSKNALYAVKKEKITIENSFCVGQKTALVANNVTEVAEDSQKLADIIVKKHSDKAFTFFCGNLRRDELPNTLSKNKVKFCEYQVYKTVFISKRIKENYDGILFFSPSAVLSFIKKNNFRHSQAFCIGPTTADKAREFTAKVKVSKTTSVESVLECVKNHYS